MLTTIKKKLLNLGLQVSEHKNTMIAYWDKNLVCRFANDAYTEWFGITPYDLINKVKIQQVLGSLYEANLPYITGVLNGKVQVFEREIKIPSGEVNRSSTVYCPDFQGSEVIGFYVHVEDITPLVSKDILTENLHPEYHANTEKILDDVIKTLTENLYSEFPGITCLAKQHFISESKLKRDFKDKHNLSIFSFYRNLQMEAAAKYFTEKRYSKKQLAAMFNFSNPSNFSACYQKFQKEKATHRLIDEIKPESDERYLTFITQAPFAIAMFDKEMCFLAASERWMKEYGLTGRDLNGVSCYEMFPGIESKWREVHSHCLKGNIRHCDEEFFVRENGHACWLRWDIRPWYNHNKAIGGLLIYTEDLTEVKLKDAENKKILEVFERTSEIALIGAWKRNFRNNTGIWNQMTKQLLEVPDDYEPDVDLAMDFYKEGESRSMIKSAYHNAITKGIQFDIEAELITAKGNLKKVRVICYPEFYNGKCERIFGLFQDISTKS